MKRIIREEITSEVVEKVKTYRSWALIADTTQDVTHKKQLSICVRAVSEAGSALGIFYPVKEQQERKLTNCKV